MNWNKKEFSVKTFFLVNIFNLLLIDLHISSTNQRNVVRGIQYLLEAMGEATEGLCTLWDILTEVRPQQVPAYVRATLTATATCASSAEVLGIARMSVTTSSQYSPAFAVLYCIALTHRMVQLSWCRLHPVKRLRSVSSSCSEESAYRQPSLSNKAHCLHKLCSLKVLAERGGKFFK